ncbi:hypothetical protein [Microcystis sp. MC19]|nr:hypothetical protein [Microcystis sp. MC19]
MNNPSTLAFSSVQRTSHELVKKSKRMKIIVNSIPNLVPLILHFGGRLPEEKCIKVLGMLVAGGGDSCPIN